MSGTVTAANRREAVATISAKSLFPVEVKGAAAETTSRRYRRVPAQVLAVTFGQLGDLLRSGVPLLRALDVLRQQSTRPAMKEVLAEIHHEVEQGASLADALGRFPRMFGEMAISMVPGRRRRRVPRRSPSAAWPIHRVPGRSGEADHRRYGLPCGACHGGTIVIAVLLVGFVPRFRPCSRNLRERGDLPAMTEVVLAVSGFVRMWGLRPSLLGSRRHLRPPMGVD